MVGDLGIALYPVFDEPQAALDNVVNDCGEILELLQLVYDLDEFSLETWKSYYNAIYQYLDNENKVDWYNEFEDRFVKLDTFCDFYENQEINNYLVSTAAGAESVSELLENDTFITSLPYYALDDLVDLGVIAKDVEGGYCENLFNAGEDKSIEEVPLDSLALSLGKKYAVQKLAFNKANAKAYAKQYAEIPNPNYYFIDGADCTNFASQIAVAGGKNPTKKWRTYIELGFWKFTKAWSNANGFVNYWGIDYSFTSHKTFADYLRRGDFITYDKNANGKWDHVGYVVNKRKKYNSSIGYINYKVAQHTTNYCKWAKSDICGWDELKSSYPRCVYGIVRMN